MILSWEGTHPKIGRRAFIARNAFVIGDVVLGDDVGVWYNAVIRGDWANITIGSSTSVQDGAVLHIDIDKPLIVGDYVTIGHNAVLHSCTVGSNVLIGMGAVLMESTIPDDCIVGAGSLVPSGKVFPERTLILGNPARPVRDLSEEEVGIVRANAEDYVKLAASHRQHGDF